MKKTPVLTREEAKEFLGILNPQERAQQAQQKRSEQERWKELGELRNDLLAILDTFREQLNTLAVDMAACQLAVGRLNREIEEEGNLAEPKAAEKDGPLP